MPQSQLLTLVTNRYDIYLSALNKKINVIFSDFDPDDYPKKEYSAIVYRISKEKALTHHLINQAAQLLEKKGTLVISGYKQEGIKTYSDKIKKTLKASGKLEKTGVSYIGKFSSLDSDQTLDDKNYTTIQKVKAETLPQGYFFSKPGVFGWNKIDKGSELLIASAQSLLEEKVISPKNVLDLGCGYGWIFLNMEKYAISSITATDNNAAAILSAEENTKLTTTPLNIIASNCADSIKEKFDLILCNPPFHQGFKHNQELTGRFLHACKDKLSKQGTALFVLNEFIAIDNHIKKEKLKQKILTKKLGFKVVIIEHK
ncbi:MAG: 16S rRNA (guanine1207-N2)-methyltransferase [Cellvibrionaceae bacterium]